MLVLPEIKKRDPWASFMENVSQGLGNAGQSFGQQFQQTMQDQEQKKDEMKRLGQENMAIYSRTGLDLRGITDPNQRREIVSRQLQGQNQKQKHESDAARLRGEQAELNQAIQRSQQIYSDPNLSDEEKFFGIQQELQKNPQIANNIISNLHKTKKSREDDAANANKIKIDQLSGTAFAKGYKAILNNKPDDLASVIEDPEVPYSVKKQLADIQNQMSTREDVKKRENRTRLNNVKAAYDKSIAAERNRIGKSGGRSKSQVAEINNRIKELEDLKKADLQKIIKNPDSYDRLQIWGNPASDFMPGLEEDEEDFEEEEKIQFDSKNPEHKARALQILQNVGGDRAKANKILAEEFSK